MQYTIQTEANQITTTTDLLIAFVFNDSKGKKTLDKTINSLANSLQKSGDLGEKVGNNCLIIAPQGVKAKRLLFIQCGASKNWQKESITNSINTLANQISQIAASNAAIICPTEVLTSNSSFFATQLAQTITSSQYRYSKTLSEKANPASLKKLQLLADKTSATALRRSTQLGKAIGNGMNIAKELGNLPANICTPNYLANQAKALARKNQTLTTKVLNEKQMKELGMGSLLSVSAGSVEPAKFIIMEYKGAKSKSQAPTVLVGKGVTFDTGGISLKPGAKMDEMKYDMCGAASVLGTMNTIVEAKAAINVVGIIAATENMPSGIATKPGDVVTSMSGQTIEVLNTDAEGRLILADALTYAERFKPTAVIDIATLTGACVVALGHVNTGLYTNHQPLADKLLDSGNSNGDYVWQMPLNDAYQKQLHSPFADIANIGGPAAGSVTAACFLSRFTKNYHWAHLDIAGTAWTSGAKKSATGRPVAMLTHYLLG